MNTAQRNQVFISRSDIDRGISWAKLAELADLLSQGYSVVTFGTIYQEATGEPVGVKYNLMK